MTYFNPRAGRVLSYFITVILTLVLLTPFWIKQGAMLTFDYETQKNLELQIFWQTELEKPFSQTCSIKEQINGSGTAHILIPASSSIKQFRLDAGSNPGKLIISNVSLKGKSLNCLNLTQFRQKNINSYNGSSSSIHIESFHKDPYIVYALPLSIEPGLFCEWAQGCIVIVVALYLACVLCDMWNKRGARSPQKKQPTLQNIEFLRILFTLFVLISHFFAPFHIPNMGGQAVEFFFLLSGYLLALTYRPERKISDIAVNRYVRFVPLVVLGGILSGGGWASFEGCLMIQNTGLLKGDIPNQPAWYIAVLFWCSLFYVGLMKQLSNKAMIMVVSVIAFLTSLMVANTLGDRLECFAGFMPLGMLRGLSCMAIGIVLAQFCKRHSCEHINTGQKLVYTLAEFVILFYIIVGCFDSSIRSSLWFYRVLSHMVLLYLFVLKRGYISSLLDNPACGKMGKYCLAIYLTHFCFAGNLRHYIKAAYPGWLENHVELALGAAIIGSCIVGILAYYIVEKPCSLYLTRFINWLKTDTHLK